VHVADAGALPIAVLVLSIHQDRFDSRLPRSFDIVENTVADVYDFHARAVRRAQGKLENLRVRFFYPCNRRDDEKREIVMHAKLAQDILQIGGEIGKNP